MQHVSFSSINCSAQNFIKSLSMFLLILDNFLKVLICLKLDDVFCECLFVLLRKMRNKYASDRRKGLCRPLVADAFSWIVPDVQQLLQFWFPTWCKFKAAVWSSAARGTGGSTCSCLHVPSGKWKFVLYTCFPAVNVYLKFEVSFDFALDPSD